MSERNEYSLMEWVFYGWTELLGYLAAIVSGELLLLILWWTNRGTTLRHVIKSIPGLFSLHALYALVPMVIIVLLMWFRDKYWRAWKASECERVRQDNSLRSARSAAQSNESDAARYSALLTQERVTSTQLSARTKALNAELEQKQEDLIALRDDARRRLSEQEQKLDKFARVIAEQNIRLQELGAEPMTPVLVAPPPVHKLVEDDDDDDDDARPLATMGHTLPGWPSSQEKKDQPQRHRDDYEPGLDL